MKLGTPLLIILVTILALNYVPSRQSAAPGYEKTGMPTIIKDNNLKAELVSEGLQLPTSMAFVGPNDILVLGKDNGIIQRIVNGNLLPEPVLDVNVANKNERGMLGIAVAKNLTGPTINTYVFVYFTESTADGNDDCPSPGHCNPGSEPLGNRLYRYELVNNKLINPKLLLDLPATPGPGHNGGAIRIGPDNNIYVPIGELRNSGLQKGISSADGRGGVLRVTQNGEAVGAGILGNTYPLNLYYAYGMRNSFGIDFDPVTGKLWDTENGPDKGDEINLVEPGFNSGWATVAGMWARKGDTSSDSSNIVPNPTNLLDFGGKAKYSPPEFSWFHVVGPTGIKFLNSDKLGTQYQNDLFVGDFHNGNLYHFKLNKDRTGLALDGPLADTIANDDTELSTAIFGNEFGSITDLEVGPDGYLYVVSIGLGAIYRIVPVGNLQ
ncbi:MAG TPA: PQQ-dependent sugar dehydrogenase [Nitrososphaeraceae archaeon]|nr:PQQ-dependent sugar dehydrogenase [Nitrososphaeraceae archaeon]